MKNSFTPWQFSGTSIGVSIDKIECMINNEDSLKLMVWDLKGDRSYRILHESFSMGTAGALIFFDISSKESFDEVDYWINLFYGKSIPIYLIGTKCDLKHEIDEKEIIDVVKKHDLKGYFIISIKNEDVREPILKTLIKSLRVVPPNSKLSIITPQQDVAFQKFINLFSFCPICGKENHFDYLKNFYFNEDSESVKIKNSLLKAVKNKEKIKYYHDLTIGIPCCNCFNKIIKKNL
ncbi:MAG: hypothetical protein ACTSUN_11570 [Promethearchaeota archaeon]